MECGAPQRHIVAEQPPAQLVEQFGPAVDLWSLDQQPARDLAARDRCTQAGIGTFGTEELFAAGSRCRLGWYSEGRCRGQFLGLSSVERRLPDRGIDRRVTRRLRRADVSLTGNVL